MSVFNRAHTSLMRMCALIFAFGAASTAMAGFVSFPAMTTARTQHVTIQLQNGKVLAPGGLTTGGTALATSELYDPATRTWSAAASMATPRYLYTAVLLPNGKVLVAGGTNGTILASAELYDPGTNTWSSAGSMATSRIEHTMLLLNNDLVLVVGGQNGSFHATCELYDPATNSWSAGGSMASARYQHTTTLLQNGEVLVSGGYNGSVRVINAEKYNSGTNTWSAAGTNITARTLHNAICLPNGQVLVCGGTTPSTLNTAELYNPGTNSWVGTNPMVSARRDFASTLLPNGRVLVTGGFDGSIVTASAEIYDPVGGTFSGAGTLANARHHHCSMVLPNGNVLITGGDEATFLNSVEQFVSEANFWLATNPLNSGREFSTGTLLPNGKVLVVGGLESGGANNKADIFDPGPAMWSAGAVLATPRHSHTATLLNSGKVLVAGGENPSFVNSAEKYDYLLDSWGSAGALNIPRSFHVAVLLRDGRVLVAGGQSSSVLSQAEIYDPAASTWTLVASMSAQRRSPCAALLPDGRVLVAGGSNGTSIASAEIYDPVANTWTNTGAMGTARTEFTLTVLPNGKLFAAGGSNGAAFATTELYNPATGTWSGAAPMSTPRYVHRATLLDNGNVLVSGGISGLSSAEIYDYRSNTWMTTVPLANGRHNHTSTLLPDGQVLVTGGHNGATPLSTVERFNRGLNYTPAWQPIVGGTNSPLSVDAPLILSGTFFKGFSSAGNGYSDASATNYPLVELQSLVDGKTAFLPSDPATNWSDTGFTSKPLVGFRAGFARMTIYVNGIPSLSKFLTLTNAAPTDLAVSPLSVPENAAAGTVVGSFSATDANAGESFSYQLVVGVGSTDNALFTIAGTQLSTAAVFDFEAQSGYSIRVRVTDSAGNIFEKPLPISVTDVNEPSTPVLSGPSLVTGVVGSPLPPVTITGTNNPSMFTATGLPPGLSINNSGVISGTPTVAGNFNVQVTGSNAAGSGMFNLTITIDPPAPITIISPPSASAQVGSFFQYVPAAVGPGTILFSTSTLPPGLSFSTLAGTGPTISGTPTLAGVYTVALTASNGISPDETIDLVIVVVGIPPKYDGLISFTAKVGAPFSYDIPTDDEVPVTLVITGLPDGISFVGTTIAGTPTEVGTFTATVVGSTDNGASFTGSLTFNVLSKNANLPPELSEILVDPDKPFIGEAVIFAVEASDPENRPVTVSWNFGDGSSATDAETMHSFAAAGDYTVTVSASDGVSTTTQTVLVNVAVSDPDQPRIFEMDINDNPTLKDQAVTFSADVFDPNDIALTYSWNFGDGTPLASSPTPTHTYTKEGTFVVGITVTNANGLVSREFKTTMFVLSPGGEQNINTGTTTVNPLNGLSQTVTFSDDGVLRLSIGGLTQTGATMSRAELRATNDLETDFGIAGRSVVRGDTPVTKIPKPGIFVATSVARDRVTREKKAKVRKTLPVSRKELGLPAIVEAEPKDKTIQKVKLSGEFILGRSGASNLAQTSDGDVPSTIRRPGISDKLAVRGMIEMPDGLDMSVPQEVQIAFGNIVDKVIIDKRGVGIGKFSRLSIKATLRKGSKLTQGGTMARFTLKMNTANMVDNGFDTEGVSAQARSNNLSIQCAMMVGGVVYAIENPVQLKVSPNGESAGMLTRSSGARE
jgi:PKD repeat protein